MKKKRFDILTLIAVFLVGAAVACVACVLIFPAKFGSPEAYKAAGKFATVYNTVKESYVGEADMDTAADIAYDALVQYSTDEWSYYMTAEGYANYKSFQNNSYSGIGVTIEKTGGDYLKVYSVTEDGPAQKAGIEPGELLIKLNDTDLAGMSTNEVKELIANENGSEFTLTLGAEDGTQRQVTLAAAEILTDPVEYEMLPNNVGYVRIKNFEERSGDMTVAAVNDLVSQGAQSLVFDVRGNPGGLLTELLEALDALLPEGDMFVAVDKDGNEQVTKSDGKSVDLPMAVLINSDTYSAAEFFSAALSEYGKAVLVGEATTGKSHSQETLLLSDGSAIHVSTRAYLTPHRRDLAEEGGLKPDVEVTLTDDEAAALASGKLAHDADPQLQAAVEAEKTFSYAS